MTKPILFIGGSRNGERYHINDGINIVCFLKWRKGMPGHVDERYTRHIFNYPRGAVEVFAHESIKHKSDIVALLINGYVKG